jgi:hypothetical protein
VRRCAPIVAAAALSASLLSAYTHTTDAGPSPRDTVPNPPTTAPAQPLACYSYYYSGCPPRHIWRPGIHGWGCYPC